MSMKTTKAVPDRDKGRAETSAISNLEAIMRSARQRQSRTRSNGVPVPLRNIEDVPEKLRPYSRYISGRNARPSTMDSYRYKAMAAQRFLIEAGMDPNLADFPLNSFPWHLITPAIAAEYWQVLARRYSNVKSRENLIGVVRRLTRECATAGLISYADREQILDSLPVQSAPMSRPGREVDDREIQLLLTTHTTSSHRLNLRNVAIVAVFLSTGLRVSEVAELSVGDIVFDERGAAVNVRRTKSGTTHLAWLNLTAVPYVKDWLAVRGEGDGALFDTDARRHVNMSAGCLRQVVARHAHAAGLTRRLGCHDFRRTFATRALRGGADPFSVQKLLGHKNVNTTLVYDYRGELETRAIVEMLIIPTHFPRTW